MDGGGISSWKNCGGKKRKACHLGSKPSLARF